MTLLVAGMCRTAARVANGASAGMNCSCTSTTVTTAGATTVAAFLSGTEPQHTNQLLRIALVLPVQVQAHQRHREAHHLQKDRQNSIIVCYSIIQHSYVSLRKYKIGDMTASYTVECSVVPAGR